MSILTEDEVVDVYFREKWDFETSLDYERAIESAVLEKLVGMVRVRVTAGPGQ